MPVHPTLRIRELFFSFQGEGARMGVPSVFVRLAGCSLRCTFCDTKESWDPEAADTQTIEVSEILRRVEEFRRSAPCSQVVITGGEPQEQNLYLLVRQLKDRNIFTAIETNGNHFQDLPLDWWTVSPKPTSNYCIHRELAQQAGEIKLVVSPELTTDVVKNVREQVRPGAPIYLQPEGYDDQRFTNTYVLFYRCQELGIENVRCGIQLHKVYKVR